jgi:putative NIF3 family GTP cyclohydrolase 1 type 2
MQAQAIIDYVFEIAPNPSTAWENVFLAGDGSVDVNGIAVAWWLTPDLVEDMEKRGLNLGLSHERPIFELPARFVWGILPPEVDIPANQRIRAAARRGGMAIHQMHSNIDKADWGMPNALFARLGWQDYPIDWSRGVPVIDLPPCTLRELIAELKTKLELPFVRYDGDLDRTVRRAACAWGGLCQGWAGAVCASPLGYDVLLGGDIIDGVVRLARAEGWAVVDAMHHATEMDGMRVLARKLEARFPGLPLHFYENDCPWQAL